MGCFSYTCCLSELTISAGDRVKYFLLTENPYDDSRGCSSHDWYFPRTWPLTARYNDYGSIEDFDEKSPAVLQIIEGLKKDMVEVGVGDNGCHDVATYKGMSFDQTLTAIVEGRAVVIRSYEQLSRFRNEEDHKTPKWLPTLQSVTQILNEAGYAVADYDGYSDRKAYLVDEKESGWVRIRSRDFDEDAPSLEALLPVLQQNYAAMITCGSGSYSDAKEIQVMPASGPRDEHRNFLRDDRKEPLKLYQAMILQEVWDEVVAQQPHKKIKQEIHDAWNEAVKSYAPLDEIPDSLEPEIAALIRSMRLEREGLGGMFVGRSVIPFTMGLSEHFNLVAKLHAEKPFTDEQVAAFLDDVVGFCCVHNSIYPRRYWWRPSFSCGPQFGEFGAHVKWAKLLTKVSKQLQKKHRYEDED